MNDRPVITREMFEAGLAAYRATRPAETSEFNEEGVVEAIYIQMVSESRLATLVNFAKED